MANARDIIPIVLSGLAGALGGKSTASSITNAAGLTRQGRIDKQQEERRDQVLANSARSLELSEKAAKRADKGLKLAESRESRYRADQDKRDKDQREADALLEQGKSEWLEGHPGATEEQRHGLSMMTTPYQVHQFDRYWADKGEAKSLTEAQVSSRNLGEGQSVSFELEDGGRFTARGLSEGSGNKIPGWKIQDRIHDGQENYDEKVSKAYMRMSEYQDKTDEILEGQTAGSTRVANARQAEQIRLKARYERLLEPDAEWREIRDSVGGLGLGDKGINELHESYLDMKDEEQRRRQEGSAPGADINALVEQYTDPTFQPEVPINDPLSKGGQFGDVMRDTGTGIKETIRDLFSGGREGKNPYERDR